jgi:predicted ATPase
MIEEANARSERTEECWPIAELLCVKGELLLLQGAPGAAVAAEDHFRQALESTRRQGARSWELPAAAGLARLLRDQSRPADAVALQPVYDRFTGGFDTADFKAAKALLDALQIVRVVRPVSAPSCRCSCKATMPAVTPYRPVRNTRRDRLSWVGSGPS